MNYKNFDVLMLANGEVFLYLSSRFYNLSKGDGESHARSKLPAKVRKVVGSLYNKGDYLPDFFEAIGEVGTEIVEDEKVKKDTFEDLLMEQLSTLYAHAALEEALKASEGTA